MYITFTSLDRLSTTKIEIDLKEMERAFTHKKYSKSKMKKLLKAFKYFDYDGNKEFILSTIENKEMRAIWEEYLHD